LFVCVFAVLPLVIRRNANSLLEQEFASRIDNLQTALKNADLHTDMGKNDGKMALLQCERDGLLVVVQELNDKISRTNAEYRLLQESSSMPQPVSYLYSKLQEEERLEIEFSQVIKKLECRIADLQESLKQKDVECLELKARLELVLCNRSELHAIREMIEHLHLMENKVVEEDDNGVDIPDEECVKDDSIQAVEDSYLKMFGLSKELFQKMTTRPGRPSVLLSAKKDNFLPGIVQLSHTRETVA
jgi:hypothetical protein